MSQTCPHMSSCNMYAQFAVEALLGVWKVSYCQGKYETCVRYERSQRGEEVPPNLLPNGSLLPVVRNA